MVTNILIKNLQTLNRITDALNHSLNVPEALNSALTRLVDMMGLQTGWIFLRDPSSRNQWAGKGFRLVTHYNLPPAMAPGRPQAWKGGCDCQSLCLKGKLSKAYNEVRCSRLSSAPGDRRGLAVHASAPLYSGDRVLGILNVAGPDWDAFREEGLILLSNVGSQMGMALERARLLDMVQARRLHEQAALLDLSGKLLDFSLSAAEVMAFAAAEIQRLLQVDACALLLPNEDGQALVFNAVSGWRTDPMALCRLVPADERSGPGLVMQIQEPLLIEDLEQSPIGGPVSEKLARMMPASWKPAWVAAEEFRGHAVIPLIVDGRSIGVLVLNTRRPRLLDEDELRFARLMANQLAIAIENARLHQEEIKRERLEEEMAVGRQIQRSLLPEETPTIPGWEFAAYYRPARLVGGDFYDFFDLGGRRPRLGLAIADVSGKGVSAALFMALSRSIIRTRAFTGRNPLEVLRLSNRLIYRDSRSGLFLTIFYATLDLESGELVYANAGHNRPLWLRAASGEIRELATEGIVLGVFEKVHLGEAIAQIDAGDLVVFFTDGVTEAMNEAEEMFGDARLQAVVSAHRGVTAQELLEAIVGAVQTFTGETDQSDDLTLFVLRRL